jgi:hypothetical protein
MFRRSAKRAAKPKRSSDIALSCPLLDRLGGATLKRTASEHRGTTTVSHNAGRLLEAKGAMLRRDKWLLALALHDP